MTLLEAGCHEMGLLCLGILYGRVIMTKTAWWGVSERLRACHEP